MNQHDRDFFIYQILSGKTRIKMPEGTVIIKNPTIDLKYESEELYKIIFQNSSNLYLEEEIIYILRMYNLWTDEMELDYRDLPEEIDDLKIKIYNNFTNKLFRSEIKEKEKKLSKLLEIKHMWDAYTREGYATYIKNQFLLKHTATLDDRPYCNTHNIFSYYLKAQPTDKQIRELSRTEPWLTFYEMGTKLGYSDTERRLFAYTKMYLSIRESEKCPSDEIINDDYALDGWLILQRREREKNRDLRDIDQKLGNNKSKQEVFLPASRDTIGKAIFNDRKEIDKINNINDEDAKQIKNSRFAASEKGISNIIDMPDVRNKIRMKINEK